MIGGVGADAEMAAFQPLGGREDLFGLRFQPEHPPGDVEEIAADVGEFDLALAAVEEADAELLFQAFDLAGEGRLSHVEGPGGFGKAALGRHSMKGPEGRVTYRCHL